jgi:hypothetical protein
LAIRRMPETTNRASRLATRTFIFLREESEQYQQPACPINVEAPAKFKKAIKAEGDFEKLSLDPECPTELFALAPR